MKNAPYRPLLILSIAVLAAMPLSAATPDPANLPVERYALYVACNSGGPGKETLKYAYTDAVRLSRTMGEIGGIKGENSLILSNPTSREINDAFADMAALVRKNAGKARRSEFLFYYSGHSDEKAFLLGNERYRYLDLKSAIDRVPSDVHVVMLDSCYSGNFVRTKGGSRQQSFLSDDSSIVQGHAYLSSSSGFESSQESDMIQASYFTHALVSGLRGAADASGDGKVSLNELYHYAFNETLSSTELSSAGPQHPSYDITLVGSGDLVLTDLTVAESVLQIGLPFEGHFFIRDTSGILISELNKTRGTEIVLALPAGTYSITCVTDAQTTQGTVTINKGERLVLSSEGFVPVQRSFGRVRGDEIADNGTPRETVNFRPFCLELVPGVSVPSDCANANISIGALWGINDRVSGAQLNLFGGTVFKDMRGIQASAFINVANGEVHGVQAAGFLNISRSKTNVFALQASGFTNYATGYVNGAQVTGYVNAAKSGFYGAQVSGFVNVAGAKSTGAQVTGFVNVADAIKGAQVGGFVNVASEVTGVQIGLINVAKKNSGASLGLLNFIADGVMSPAMYYDTNGMAFVQYQGGTNEFFTVFLAGTDPFDRDYAEFGIGGGTRIAIAKRLSCDIEILSKYIFDRHTGHLESGDTVGFEYDSEDDSWDHEDAEEWANDFGKGHIPSLRVSVQYSFFRHLSLFAAAEAEARFVGYNDEAFRDYGKRNLRVDVSDGFKVYPVFSGGVKF